MAIRFLEGFEARQSTTYLERAWATLSGAVTSFTTQRKAGGASCRASNLTLTTRPLVSPVENTWVVGFGYLMETAATVGVHIMDASATSQLQLSFAAGTTPNTFTVAVKRGATTLATSVELQMNRWNYFEWKVTARTSTNGAYELKVNGTSILSATGVNTANTGADGASVFQFNWGGGFGSFDDIVIADGTGGVHDTFMGDKVVLAALPNGDGASLQWLPSTGSTHYTLVDDTAATPNDTDYISSNTDGDVDLFDFGATTDLAADGTLDAVVLFVDAAMLSSGSRGLKARFRTSGGSTADSTQFDVTVKGTFRSYVVPYDQDPVAASAWTKSALDGGSFGPINFVEL